MNDFDKIIEKDIDSIIELFKNDKDFVKYIELKKAVKSDINLIKLNDKLNDLKKKIHDANDVSEQEILAKEAHAIFNEINNNPLVNNFNIIKQSVEYKFRKLSNFLEE